MYLVDTSVWIDAMRPSPRGAGERLVRWLEADVSLYLTGIIYQEVLQGARDRRFFLNYKQWLGDQQFVHPRDPVATYGEAARLYAECRWRGITVRSTTDCLIAQIAIEHDLFLLHDDRDFERIASVEPRLKLA